jgi:hypothetical protein
MGRQSERTHPTGGALRITMVADPDITGGVLVLPGGKPDSMAGSRPWQLAHLRMALLARSLRRRLPPHVEVRRVRYRFRGWNPARLDALRDASAALDDLLETVDGRDVVVVDHSREAGCRASGGGPDGGGRRAGTVVARGRRRPHPRQVPAADHARYRRHWTDPVAAQAQTVRAAAVASMPRLRSRVPDTS